MFAWKNIIIFYLMCFLIDCTIYFTHEEDMQMKGRRRAIEKWIADVIARIMLHIFFRLSAYKTFLAEHISRDVTKTSGKLVKGQSKPKQTSPVDS